MTVHAKLSSVFDAAYQKLVDNAANIFGDYDEGDETRIVKNLVESKHLGSGKSYISFVLVGYSREVKGKHGTITVALVYYGEDMEPVTDLAADTRGHSAADAIDKCIDVLAQPIGNTAYRAVGTARGGRERERGSPFVVLVDIGF
jgi:hypothetical protein